VHQYTNQLVNDVARIRQVIWSKYAEHWYAGLRQAELEKTQLGAIIAKQNHPWNRLVSQIFGDSGRKREILSLHTEVCKIEKEILDRHKHELDGLSFEEIQDRYSEEAFQRRKVFVIATDALCQKYGISQSSAELLLSSSPTERVELLTEVQELTSYVSLQIIQAAMRELTPAQRESLYLEAQQIHVNEQLKQLI
jgi:hypothetical protein